MTDIVIAGGARTPVGTFNGKLSSVAPTELGVVAVQEALKRAKTDAAEVQEVIMGLVLSGNTGAVPRGRSASTPAFSTPPAPPMPSTNCARPACGPSARASIPSEAGDTEVVVAGGMGA